MRKFLIAFIVLVLIGSAVAYASQPEATNEQGVSCSGDRLSPDVIAQIYATHPDAGEPWFFVWDVCPN